MVEHFGAPDSAANDAKAATSHALLEGIWTPQAARQADATELAALAQRQLEPHAAARFKQDLADFAARAQRDGLSETDIQGTYSQLGRLLDAGTKGAVPLAERRILAEQIMHQAAHPEAVAQGGHNTCNVSTVEARIYTRYPSVAAKVVSDVALTGAYKLSTGRSVNFDAGLRASLQPMDEALANPPADGKRSYASQLFQVTAVNAKYVEESAQPGSEGKLRYEQHTATKNNPSGEEIVWYPNAGHSKVLAYSPDLDLDDVHNISNLITGKNENGFTIERNDPAKSKTSIGVDSPEALQKVLSKLADEKAFPVIMLVNTNNEPFYHDSGADVQGLAGGAHVVTITGYDKNSGRISVRNEWGTADDHTGTNALTAQMLYLSTIDPFDKHMARALTSQVIADRRNHDVDPLLELDSLHVRYINREFKTQQAYMKEFAQTLNEVGAHWNDAAFDLGKKTQCMQLISDLLRITNVGETGQIKRIPGWQEVRGEYMRWLKPSDTDPMYEYVTGYLGEKGPS